MSLGYYYLATWRWVDTMGLHDRQLTLLYYSYCIFIYSIMGVRIFLILDDPLDVT